MKMKDYTCKCGNEEFFIMKKGQHNGLYCTYCGKFFKWLNKDELNLVNKWKQKMKLESEDK